MKVYKKLLSNFFEVVNRNNILNRRFTQKYTYSQAVIDLITNVYFVIKTLCNYTPSFSHCVILERQPTYFINSILDLPLLKDFKKLASRLNCKEIRTPHPQMKYQYYEVSSNISFLLSITGFIPNVILYDTSKNSFLIVSSSPYELANQTLRVIRELLLYESIINGNILLHAGSVKLGNKGVIICGEKGSGKTTLILTLIAGLKAQYISNDWSLIREQRNKYGNLFHYVIGLPTSIRILDNSAYQFVNRNLTFYRQRGVRSQQQTGIQSKISTRTSACYERKIVLQPLELCKAMGVKFISGCRIKVLIFPSLDVRADHYEINELHDKTTVISRLKGVCLTPGDYDKLHLRLPFYNSQVINHYENQLYKKIRGLSNNLRFYEIRGKINRTDAQGIWRKMIS